MNALLGTQAMTWTTVVVLVISLLSLLTMAIVLMEFRLVGRRFDSLMAAIDTTGQWNKPHVHVLAWLYVLLTLVISIGSLLIFIFQPHIL